MSDICYACGNESCLEQAREDHLERFLDWLDQQDICLRRLGDEEVLDTKEVLQQHVDELVAEAEGTDDASDW